MSLNELEHQKITAVGITINKVKESKLLRSNTRAYLQLVECSFG